MNYKLWLLPLDSFAQAKAAKKLDLHPSHPKFIDCKRYNLVFFFKNNIEVLTLHPFRFREVYRSRLPHTAATGHTNTCYTFRTSSCSCTFRFPDNDCLPKCSRTVPDSLFPLAATALASLKGKLLPHMENTRTGKNVLQSGREVEERSLIGVVLSSIMRKPDSDRDMELIPPAIMHHYKILEIICPPSGKKSWAGSRYGLPSTNIVSLVYLAGPQRWRDAQFGPIKSSPVGPCFFFPVVFRYNPLLRSFFKKSWTDHQTATDCMSARIL